MPSYHTVGTLMRQLLTHSIPHWLPYDTGSHCFNSLEHVLIKFPLSSLIDTTLLEPPAAFQQCRFVARLLVLVFFLIALFCISMAAQFSTQQFFYILLLIFWHYSDCYSGLKRARAQISASRFLIGLIFYFHFFVTRYFSVVGMVREPRLCVWPLLWVNVRQLRLVLVLLGRSATCRQLLCWWVAHAVIGFV